ncbi:major facilitator superfamily domain-containing protein, partial [Catenaria anguillulae PL171]
TASNHNNHLNAYTATNTHSTVGTDTPAARPPRHADHAEEQVNLHPSAPLAGNASDSDDATLTASATHAPADAIAKATDDEEPEEYPGQVDGGLTAWLVVLSSFLTHVGAFGLQYSYGVFQAWYSDTPYDPLPPGTPKWLISLIGTLGPCSMFIAGLFAGRWAERHGFRPTMFAGAIVLTAGMVLASFATEAWHLALTQGVMYGIGSALLYFPAVALPTQWWVKRRAFAVGLAVAGSGVGGLVYAQVVAALLPAVGARWTLRIMGLASGVLLALAAALAETRLPRRKVSGPIIDTTMLRNPKFTPMLVGAVLTPFGFLLPYYYLPTYVVQIAGLPLSFATTLLTVLNALSIVGRVSMGYLADRAGNINSFIASVMLAGVGMFVFWGFAGSSQAMLIVFVALFGFTAGGFISLMPTVAAQLYGVATLPSILGLLYAATAAGNLAGNPIAGALILAIEGSEALPSKSYALAIGFASFMMIAGTMGTVYLRFRVLDKRFWVAL